MGGPAVRRIGIEERRARLARRHRIAPDHRADDVLDATRSIVCLHGTEQSTIYLSVWARMHDVSVADIDRLLYGDRTLVKHLAMRRTLFVFPRELVDAAQAGASNRVAAVQRRQLIKDVEASGLHRDGKRWLRTACRQVLAALADGRMLTAAELRAEIPALVGSMTYGEGRSWGGTISVGPRVLTVLSAEGRILRAANDGPWYVSRPRWGSTEATLGAPLDPPDHDEGVRILVGHWLRSFGPGTALDIKWWLGSTLTIVRRALAALDAVEVDLDGATGYVLPDDVEPAAPAEPWVALLPPLDPTTMGWFERSWYLGPHKELIFDTSGNAGPTAWSDGQIVGAWHQDDGGRVELLLLDGVPRRARVALAAEAARLTEWLDGTPVLPRYASPLSARRGPS